ncbi:tRNA lysidine(34) synthetase TilS, partial [Ralstonia pseudosolanacearum]|uniref:tRNA lysidine(34) synthetase TilS n=1 Tax=Ralstonia pseudosolanacearum TaxID=1310165 RepID=UPI003CEF52F7
QPRHDLVAHAQVQCRVEHLVRQRHGGGERIVLRPGGPSRALKQAYQEAGIPAWARARLPLLYAGERLVFAAGLGPDRSAVAMGSGWHVAWLPAVGQDGLDAG